MNNFDPQQASWQKICLSQSPLAPWLAKWGRDVEAHEKTRRGLPGRLAGAAPCGRTNCD